MGVASGTWKVSYGAHSIEVEYKTSGWAKLFGGAKDSILQASGRLIIDGIVADESPWESGILSLRGAIDDPDGRTPVVARLKSKFGVMPVECFVEIAGQEQSVIKLG
jgi:hypothetical protein